MSDKSIREEMQLLILSREDMSAGFLCCSLNSYSSFRKSSVKHSSPNGIAAWCRNLSWESLSVLWSPSSPSGAMEMASLVAVDSARRVRDSSHNNSPSLPVLFLISPVHFSNDHSIEFKSKNSLAQCIPKPYVVWVSKKSIHIVCLVVLSISITIG